MMASSRVREADWCVTLESTRAVARPRFPGPVIPEPPRHHLVRPKHATDARTIVIRPLPVTQPRSSGREVGRGWPWCRSGSGMACGWEAGSEQWLWGGAQGVVIWRSGFSGQR
jgi:hypothetical protein